MAIGRRWPIIFVLLLFPCVYVVLDIARNQAAWQRRRIPSFSRNILERVAELDFQGLEWLKAVGCKPPTPASTATDALQGGVGPRSSPSPFRLRALQLTRPTPLSQSKSTRR